MQKKRPIINNLIKPLGRLLGLGLFMGGFWLLFQGFQRSSIWLGVLGGAMMLLGLFTMAQSSRYTP
jgi:hypothetical protein